MRQRVGIARALAVRPACLLMDEPLSALDAQTRGLLLDEFAALIERAGTTTIYVTHNLAEAVRLGHRIVVLSRQPGRVRAIRRIDRPLAGRATGDADLRSIEAELWALIRDDAAAEEREIEEVCDGPARDRDGPTRRTSLPGCCGILHGCFQTSPRSLPVRRHSPEALLGLGWVKPNRRRPA